MRRSAALIGILASLAASISAPGGEFRVSTFSADVTVPLGHRLMGVLPVKAREIVDPLEARGFVLEGAGEPIVLAAVDWCEIRNEAYRRWREALAKAAGTTPERVILSAVHQHDAPVADVGAERLLEGVGLGGELLGLAFHEEAVARVARALEEGRRAARRVTHLGIGRALVERIASNRRVVRPDGSVGFQRSSSSGGDPWMREAPEGLVDPWLRMVSFWDGETPVVALLAYATHPMSTYGRGGVSADFVGRARRDFEARFPGVFAIYASGPSGDVTAGKHNDGSLENRPRLAERLRTAMERAWRSARRVPLACASLRTAPLELEFRRDPGFAEEELQRTLRDPARDVRERILAAMGLESLRRVRRGETIDLACLDLGAALVVLFPGETFVGYGLMAERIRPDSLVLGIGYGEGWPGYIPTAAAFAEGFSDSWLWVAPGAEARMREALWRALPCGQVREGAAPCGFGSHGEEPFAVDVYAATEAHPRYSEGSIVELADGALLYATTEFAGGAEDDASARIVARRSSDGGRTWGPQRTLQENVGRKNVMSVSLKRYRSAGLSGLGMFYLVKDGPSDLRVYLRISEDEAETFGPPILVTRGQGYHVLVNDRVAQLLDGRLVVPVSWTRDALEEDRYVSFAYLSDDGGGTWVAGRGKVALPGRGAMEPEVVELRDGRLLMILRTQLGSIYASVSEDRGDTWSAAEDWGVASPESPATLRRIPATGDLLLVWNPIFSPGADHGGRRNPLAAAVSRDEGKTWTPPRVLEGDPSQTFAYASLAFAGGRALLTYYVCDEGTGRISSRFRSMPLGAFYAGR